MVEFDLWEKLRFAEKPIVIYGMGDGCDKILAVAKEKGIEIKGIFASDEYVRGQMANGFPVMTYEKAKETFRDMIVLLAFGVFRSDLMAKIKKIADEVELYAPDVPLFGGGLFDRKYYEDHKENFDAVEKMLSDDFSKKAYRNTILFKLTGDPKYLWEIESDKAKDMVSLIPFQKGDVYLDLGAYDGDTALEWDTLFPDHGKIIAVEPNHKTYRKLVENCKDIPQIVPLEAAAWNQKEELSFSGKSGRSAAVSECGKTKVQGMPPDEMTSDAAFIKYDVEGAEKEAIEGSRRLISEEKASLCISAYHRTEDLYAIPLQVKEMQQNYKVYFRHSPYIPAWDTFFYFICG